MTRPAEARTFWSGVLRAGGTTTIPRWTRGSLSGVYEHAATSPN
jgi:hypothetical protein